MPFPSFSTPNMVNVSNKLPIVSTLISHTIIQNANVFRFDIFSVSSESDAFDFIAFLDFIFGDLDLWKNAKCVWRKNVFCVVFRLVEDR